MIKLQKIVSTAMMLTMLVLGLAALALPAAPAKAALIDVAYASSTIDASELGLGAAAYTGLNKTDIRITIAKLIRVAMSLLGIVAVCIVLIGGFTWMTAGGNDEKIGEAKKWIIAGVIGMVIILSAYGLANFVINSLVAATTDSSTNQGQINVQGLN